MEQKAKLLKLIFKDYIFIQNWLVTVSICKVGDCGLQTYQTAEKLKRATTVEFATISPILYIHCYAALLCSFHNIPNPINHYY